MENNQCPICSCKKIKTIHNGTRDNPNIDVLKCEECEHIFLSTFEHIKDNFYEKSKMRETKIDNKVWKDITSKDNLRRVNDLNDFIRDSVILDFGCGKGGFLDAANPLTKEIYGIELDNEIQKELTGRGYTIWNDLSECNKKVDLITMFHVIEHLIDPIETLKECYDKLNSHGRLVIETPNANDALLSLYDVKAFADFTFWSPHIQLYNYKNLVSLANKAGFEMEKDISTQRYTLANHMYWLKEGKAGGQNIWTMLNDKLLNDSYTKVLINAHMTDTLCMVFTKK